MKRNLKLAIGLISLFVALVLLLATPVYFYVKDLPPAYTLKDDSSQIYFYFYLTPTIDGWNYYDIKLKNKGIDLHDCRIKYDEKFESDIVIIGWHSNDNDLLANEKLIIYHNVDDVTDGEILSESEIKHNYVPRKISLACNEFEKTWHLEYTFVFPTKDY